MVRYDYKFEIKKKKYGCKLVIRSEKRLYTIWINHECFWEIELKQELRKTFKNWKENGKLLVFDRTRDRSHSIYFTPKSNKEANTILALPEKVHDKASSMFPSRHHIVFEIVQPGNQPYVDLR